MFQLKRFGRRVAIHSKRQIRHQMITAMQEEVRLGDEAADRAAVGSSGAGPGGDVPGFVIASAGPTTAFVGPLPDSATIVA